MARGARSKRAARLQAAMPIVDMLVAQGKAYDDNWWSRRHDRTEWYWLSTPFSCNGRGDDALAESNYRVIKRDLDKVSAYGTDYRVDLWPGGSIHTLMVRADDALALQAVGRWAAALSDYPVADEMDYSELEWEHNHPGDGYCYSDDPDYCGCDQRKPGDPDPDEDEG